MGARLPALLVLGATDESIPPTGTAARIGVRIILGGFIAVLAAYILIEQLGSWRRRRGSRDR